MNVLQTLQGIHLFSGYHKTCKNLDVTSAWQEQEGVGMADEKVIVVVKADEKWCGDPHHRLCNCSGLVPRGHYAARDERHVVIVIREMHAPELSKHGFDDGGH